MLLIFNPTHTSIEQDEVDGQIVPLNGSRGAAHIAFSIKKEDLRKWREFFNENHIPIESEVTWPNGIVSLYFRDPAGNSLEVVSPDLYRKSKRPNSSHVAISYAVFCLEKQIHHNSLTLRK